MKGAASGKWVSENHRRLSAWWIFDARARAVRTRAVVPLIAANGKGRVLHVATARLGQRTMMELAVVGGYRWRQSRVGQIRLDLLGQVDYGAIVGLAFDPLGLQLFQRRI